MARKAGEWTLHDCVRRGDLDKLTRLLVRGWPVNGRDKDGWIPVCLAADHGLTEFVEVLITNGANVNEMDKFGRIPIHRSAFQGHKAIVEILIRHGAQIEVKDTFGFTVLHKSAWQGHNEIVQELIMKGADINVKSRSGLTPLHYSAVRNHKETIQLLIHHGADMTATDRQGNTPFMLAKERGYRDCMEILEKPAGPQASDDSSFSGISTCRNRVRQVNCPSDVTPSKTEELTVHDCVRRGDLNTLVTLLHQGFPAEGLPEDRRTPLLTGALLGHTEIVRVLISFGADVAAKDKHKRTSLHRSALRGHKETVELLIQHGADIDPVDSWNKTPLMLAEECGHRDIVDTLKKAKLVGLQGGDSGMKESQSGFHACSSSTRSGSVQSSDDKSQVAQISQEGYRGHKKQVLVTKSAETPSYLVTSEVDVCTLSSPSSELASASQTVTASPKTSASPPAQRPKRRGKMHFFQKASKAGKRNTKSDQESPRLLAGQLNKNVYIIKETTVNNHYYTYNSQNISYEEVKIEPSKTVNVCVRGQQHVYQCPPQDDDYSDEDVDENIPGADPD